MAMYMPAVTPGLPNCCQTDVPTLYLSASAYGNPACFSYQLSSLYNGPMFPAAAWRLLKSSGLITPVNRPPHSIQVQSWPKSSDPPYVPSTKQSLALLLHCPLTATSRGARGRTVWEAILNLQALSPGMWHLHSQFYIYKPFTSTRICIRCLLLFYSLTKTQIYHKYMDAQLGFWAWCFMNMMVSGTDIQYVLNRLEYFL